MRLMCSRYERSTSAESGSGFLITRPILRPLALSIHWSRAAPQRRLYSVSKKEGLTRRFPGVRFRGRTSPDTVLFFRLTKLCLIPPS